MPLDDYFGDVAYDVWRSGGDVDRIDRDRVREHEQYGDDAEIAARHELRVQAHERHMREMYPEDWEEA